MLMFSLGEQATLRIMLERLTDTHRESNYRLFNSSDLLLGPHREMVPPYPRTLCTRSETENFL